MHSTPLRIVRNLSLAVLPWLIGCNVSDYEQRMLLAQAVLKQRDEEARLLEGPCDVPGPKDGSPPDIFFRPPRGINPQPQNRENPRGGLVFHYQRTNPAQPTPPNPQPQPNPPPPPPPQPPPQAASDHPALSDVYIAYRVDADGKGGSGFIDEVLKQFPHNGESAKKPRTIQPIGREPMVAEAIEFVDVKSMYLAVFHRTPNLQVVIVFRADLGKLPSLQKTLDVSLATLAVGEVAVPARQEFTDDDARRVR